MKQMDREKVIKGLEICRHRVISQENCKECPYIYDGRAKQSNCEGVLHWDALALLKEQEAVEPKTEPSAKGYWYTCGVCGWWLFEVRDTVHFDDRKRIHFCASCGQAVKWE